MIDLLIRWGLVSALFLGSAAVLPTIKVKGWGAALRAGLVLGIANVLLGYPLKFVAKLFMFLPNLLTFGLVGLVISLVVNVVLLRMTDKALEKDLEINGLPTTVGLSLAISVVCGLT
jgi:uncharacterized membrane protein YvlD (DUF360 family)